MKFNENGKLTVALSTALSRVKTSSFTDCDITNCSLNPKQTTKDGLYACAESDPQAALDAILAAKNAGAIAVVAARELEPTLTEAADKLDGVQVIYADDPREAYGQAVHALRGFPGRKMRLIGISGSAGKTSLSYVVGGVLAEAGLRVGLIGSLGVYDGKKLSPTLETTPEPARLAELLDEMVKNGCECAVIEASSVALAEGRLAGLELDAACLTNIRRDHLDYHGSVDAYRRAKIKLFSYVKETGVAICNVDDRVTEAALHMIDRPLLTVGVQPTVCSVSGTPVERQSGEQIFYVVAGTDAAPIRTSIVGKEHIYNCLEAAALGVSWKIDMKTIARGIERVAYIPGRMERVDCGQPFAVYLDRANSPDSLAAALEAARSVALGNVYCVLCAPNDGDHTKRPLMGRAAESGAEFVAITRGNLAESQTLESFDELRRGFEKPDAVQIIPDRKAAIIWALSRASVDDAVVIVGQDVSSLDSINEYFVPDRQFVRNWLYENQTSAESYWFN